MPVKRAPSSKIVTKAGDDGAGGQPTPAVPEPASRPSGGAAPEPERPRDTTSRPLRRFAGSKIDLASAPSAMELAARAVDLTPRPAAEIQAAIAAGKVPCGPCDAYVPAWFGDGCISARCPLKGRVA